MILLKYHLVFWLRYTRYQLWITEGVSYFDTSSVYFWGFKIGTLIPLLI